MSGQLFDALAELLPAELDEVVAVCGARTVLSRNAAPKTSAAELLQWAKSTDQNHEALISALDRIGRPVGHSGQPTRDWELKHLQRLISEHGMLQPAIPPRDSPQEWPMSEVFVPLEVQARRDVSATGGIDWGALIERDRVVLTGEAGSGKSTLLRNLTLAVVEQRRRHLEGDPPADQRLARIPVWIDLPAAARQLRMNRRGESFRDLVPTDWLPVIMTAAAVPTRAEARGLLDTGDTLLVCDGLDEIADRQERADLVTSLARVTGAFGPVDHKNWLVVGCRDKAWERKGEFASFDQILIRPMDRPKWEEYLGRWCEAVWANRAEEVLANLRRSLRSSTSVQEMASNPQTATMLTVLASHGPLPGQRVNLYDQFLDVALASERMEQHGGRADIRRHLIALALTIQNDPREGVSEKTAQLSMGKRLAGAGAEGLTRAELRALGEAFLDDLELHTGLISIDRDDPSRGERSMIRFKHRTIQEFLVASSFVEDPEEILEHVTNPAWLVPIVLTTGLLARDEDYDILEDFLRHLVRRTSEETDFDEGALIEWGQRVAALSGCLEELSNWSIDDQTLAPALEAHLLSGPLLMRFDPASRISIAEGMGILRDPRLASSVTTRWVEIAAGPSMVGCDEPEAWIQERPARKTQLSAHWIQRWPVTVREYGRFVDDGGYEDETWWDETGWRWRLTDGTDSPLGWDRERTFGNRPVTGVSWWEARAYARWLTSVEDLPPDWVVTLPTEAQWERAARGPFDDEAHAPRRFPWGNSWDPDAELANCAGAWPRVVPVGLFPAGNAPEGIWDLAGNVGERCLDGFKAPDPSDRVDQCCVDYRFGHAVRGGDFASPVLNARVSARFPELNDTRSNRIGFRCVAWNAPEGLRP